LAKIKINYRKAKPLLQERLKKSHTVTGQWVRNPTTGKFRSQPNVGFKS